MGAATNKAGATPELAEPQGKVLITEPVEHDQVYMPVGTTYVGPQSVCDHLVAIGVAQAVEA